VDILSTLSGMRTGKMHHTTKTPIVLSGISAAWLVMALMVGQAQLLKALPIFAAAAFNFQP
jgi:hypothetical protein